MSRTASVIVAFLVVCSGAVADDSVDVTFRYRVAGKTNVSVPGEFNGWTPANGRMMPVGGDEYILTVRLRVGGNPAPPANGIPGAWQYKFWYDGVGSWPNDPLNHHVNPSDNNNTFIYTRDVTIYQLVPNQRNPIVATASPTISAYLFPKVGTEVDTAAIRVAIDGAEYAGVGSGYDTLSHRFSFVPPVPLGNGEHTVILTAGTSADTVRFSTQAGYVLITTQGGFSTWSAVRTLRGTVQDTSVKIIRLVRNSHDTTVVPASAGRFVTSDTLTEGANTFVAVADSAGTDARSAPVTITLLVNHAPYARVIASGVGGSVLLDAGPTTDPDGQTALTFVWLDDDQQPIGVAGLTGKTVTVPQPATPGEYYFGLIARDPDGNSDTTRGYFIVRDDGTVKNPVNASHPAWARQARVYFLLPKSFSEEGTINAVTARLPYIRDMGFSVIWLTPVMRNGPPIDNWYNPGYNIVDFTAFAPEYGSREDFSDFMQQAHALGIKVILDITPNHSGRNHPWAVHARTYGEDSPYWFWYEHTIIPHNTNGLGQSVDAYGFTYYSGFSEQLLNLNWKDIDLQMEMVRAYLYWVKEFGVDGFRHDVYWGPHRRYGEQFMGKPLRDALKHVKPDILLLGEDDGTGSGTEVIYADWLTGGINGGVDAAYDFKLYFNQIRGFGFSPAAINGLHGELDNGGFYPGENALYMRFMESQDEDRITYFYSGAFTLDSETTFRRTMPMATVIFTSPGFPMLWNGQEVGWGYGITGQKENRNRSVIDWNYEGRTLLSPHYQKLATLRGQFPAFTQHKRDTNGDGGVTAADSSDFLRVASSNSAVYAFARPWSGQNGLTVANFAATEQTASLNLWTPGVLIFPWVVESSNLLWVNNLTEGTWTQVRAEDLSALVVTLPAYGSAVYTVSASRDTLRVQNPITGVGAPQGTRPEEFLLEQNYPNPFNPVTTIRFSLPDAGDVELGVFDLLGREVDRLQAGRLEAGAHTLQWDGRSRSGSPLSSGVYLYRLVHRSTAGKEQSLSRAMILLR